MKRKTFRRHFRIYFVNNHPAYIVDEEGNKYVFHRVTHSKTSGGKKTWNKPNPIDDNDRRPIHIVKRQENDDKARFSLFEIELKPGVDISYPEIKKARRVQTSHDLNRGRTTISSSTSIKSNGTKKIKKK